MLRGLRSLLATLTGPAHPAGTAADDPRVAAAALLFHLMDVDGIRDETEQSRLRAMLRDAYALDDDALDTLLTAGEQAESEAVDMHGFTSVLMRHWDHDQHIEFVGQLWALVFADGEMHELEDHTLWRVADLLGIDGRDRVEARRRAAAALGAQREQG